jgi:hypothetical protein
VLKGVHRCSRMCMGCAQGNECISAQGNECISAQGNECISAQGNECISAQGCAWVVFKEMSA